MHPLLSRRRLLLAAGLLASPLPARSQGTPVPFTPKLGQFGKDVVWLPTPDALAARLLRMAQVRAGDVVVDLGSGDGKVVIAAARDFGALARGVEYDARLVALARQHARAAGVAARARFDEGDLFDADLHDADVIFLYLLPTINLRLRPQLLRLAPGTRIVAHQFAMGDWQPDETTVVEHRTGFLWIVPANAGGVWALDLPQADGTTVAARLEITQTFQRIEGVAALADMTTDVTTAMTTTLRAPRLSGRSLAFGLTDAAGALRQFDAEIEGECMHGTVDGVAFMARRLGAAPAIIGSGPATLAEERRAGALLGDF